MLDLGAGQTTAQQVAEHGDTIRCIETIESGGKHMLVTGSWDKTIKYWDLRSPQAAATVDMGERVYSMSVRNNTLVVGMADRWISVINLGEPSKIYRKIQSPLKWQTRVVACLNDASGYAIGSIEGRCAMQYIDDNKQKYVFISRLSTIEHCKSKKAG